MLKSVVQALPTYAMSLFLIPDNLCSSLEKMMNSFWWGSDGSRKSGIHWKAWDRLCIPKKFGGMGFRKLHHFNIALLAKQGWRLLTNPNSLVARVYKVCYNPDSSFLDAALGDKPNYIWRSILAAQHLVSTSAQRLVGFGKDINIWRDPWLPDEVEDLLSEHGKFWDMDLIQGIFTPRDQELVKKVSLSIRLLDDGWYWLGDHKGSYSVKSGYHRLTRLNFCSGFFEELAGCPTRLSPDQSLSSFSGNNLVPPASGYIKLNADGAIFSKSGFAGFGLVLRGPDSVFLAARNDKG
ncbi:hypothetical protein OROMI_003069 [Orobanche minor]